MNIDIINIGLNKQIPQRVIKRINKGEKIAIMKLTYVNDRYGVNGELYNMTDEEFNRYCSVTKGFLKDNNIANSFVVGD